MKRKYLFLHILMILFSDVFSQDESLMNFVFPIMKVQNLDNSNSSISKIDSNNTLLYKKIAGDILCFYGIDKGSYFTLLHEKDIPEDMQLQQLDSIAKNNLLKEIGDKLMLHETEYSGYSLTCGGIYEAALINLPEVWSIMKERFGRGIIFAIPSKDVVMFQSSDNKEGIMHLKKVINKIHNVGDMLLSKYLYKYDDGIISVYSKN